MVAGRKVIGILVRPDKYDPVNLYFDKETYLLAKYDRRFKDDGAAKEVYEETFLSDYRTVRGSSNPIKRDIESVGQNRHRVADERAAWKRSSEPFKP